VKVEILMREAFSKLGVSKSGVGASTDIATLSALMNAVTPSWREWEIKLELKLGPKGLASSYRKSHWNQSSPEELSHDNRRVEAG